MLDESLDHSPSTRMARIYQLRLVCKWFQETIDNTASFWTTLSLVYPAPVLADALQRSRNHLLTIINEIPEKDIDAMTLVSFLEMVSGHLDRWQDVTLYLPQVRTLQQYLQGPAPFLKSLTLIAHDYVEYSPNDLDLSHLEANRLSKLTLDGMRFCWTDSLLQGLTEVDIKNLPVVIPRRQITESLSAGSALQSLRLTRIATLVPIAEDSHITAVLPLLRELWLEDLDLDSTRAITRSIAAPICSDVRLLTTGGSAIFVRGFLADDVLPSFPALRDALFSEEVEIGLGQEADVVWQHRGRGDGTGRSSLWLSFRDIVDFESTLNALMPPTERRSIHLLVNERFLGRLLWTSALSILGQSFEVVDVRFVMESNMYESDLLALLTRGQAGSQHPNFPALRTLTFGGTGWYTSNLLTTFKQRYTICAFSRQAMSLEVYLGMGTNMNEWDMDVIRSCPGVSRVSWSLLW